MAAPRLDGKPLGPSPDELRTLYIEGALDALEHAMMGRSEDSREIVRSVLRKTLEETNLDRAGLLAVWLHGNQTIEVSR